MGRKYAKISEENVVSIIIGTTYCWNGCGIIAPSNIASLLKTSRYQVDKHIKSLKKKGLIEYKSILMYEEEFYPPYNGYKLSEKGKKVYSKELEEYSRQQDEAIKKCFGT